MSGEMRRRNLEHSDRLLLQNADRPDVMIEIAETDGIVTLQEAVQIADAHRKKVRVSDIAIKKWLIDNGYGHIRVANGDRITIREAPVVHPSDPSISYSIGEPFVNAFGDFGEWLLHPRRRQKLLWLAIVTPAVVICLAELL